MTLKVVVAGMHLAPEFGDTVREIEADGWPIEARVPMSDGRDSAAATARGLGLGLAAMADVFERLAPDIVMVLGDRVEAFAAAAAAGASNRGVAHIHGGDVTRGGIDESMRHAITKLAHLHFAATERSRERIVRMGEDPDRVFVVGAPGLDSIRTLAPLSLADVGRALGIALERPYVVLVQHPVSTRPDAAAREIEETLEALSASGRRTICIYPNADAGGRRMIAAIERHRGEPWLVVLPNAEHDLYLNLLRHADALVGNSSSGIIEAGMFHLPVVNVGERQHGRERGANVVDAPPERDAIKAVLQQVTRPEFAAVAASAANPYGDGHASERIAATLAKTRVSPALLQKQLTY